MHCFVMWIGCRLFICIVLLCGQDVACLTFSFPPVRVHECTVTFAGARALIVTWYVLLDSMFTGGKRDREAFVDCSSVQLIAPSDRQAMRVSGRCIEYFSKYKDS
jgi:hypothetical protein